MQEKARGRPWARRAAAVLCAVLAAAASGARADRTADMPVTVNAFTYQSRGPYQIGQYVRQMETAGVRYDMRVFYPVLNDDEGSRPVIACIHPAQAVNVSPSTQYWQVCQSAASWGWFCILSMERNCCRGRRQQWPVDLATRHLEMYRQLLADAQDPGRPFFGKVRRQVCAVGYSMAGSSATRFFTQSRPSDNVMCVAPLHSTRVGAAVARAVGVPLFYGNSLQDTVIRAAPGIAEYRDNTRTPTYMQILREGRHAVDGIMGRHQANFLKFFRVVMDDDQRCDGRDGHRFRIRTRGPR